MYERRSIGPEILVFYDVVGSTAGVKLPSSVAEIPKATDVGTAPESQHEMRDVSAVCRPPTAHRNPLHGVQKTEW